MEASNSADTASSPSEGSAVLDKAVNIPVSPEKRIEEIAAELKRAISDLNDTKSLMSLGFVVLLVMVGTMIVSVVTLFIEVIFHFHATP